MWSSVSLANSDSKAYWTKKLPSLSTPLLYGSKPNLSNNQQVIQTSAAALVQGWNFLLFFSHYYG